MSHGTHNIPSQRSLIHITAQAQLVLLLEIWNNPCRSLKLIIYKMFHASETLPPNERKNQRSFQMFQKFESFMLPNAFSFLLFVFKTVKERCQRRKKKN